MFMSRRQSAAQYRNMLIYNEPFDNMAKFKHLGTKVTNQNCIYEKFKSEVNSDDARSHSGQKFCPPVCTLKTLRLKYKNL